MILEVANLVVRPGLQEAFERAFEKAERLIAGTTGYIAHELQRSLERDHHYLLLIEWRRVEDHTLGFRKSNDFDRWRALMQDLLDSTPEVEHFRLVRPHGARQASSAD